MLNAGVLAGLIKGQLQTHVGPFYEDPADDHTLPGYTIDNYFDRLSTAIANAVVQHIVTAARAQGLDSPGMNTHDLNIV